jgi:hypothetical protein
MKKTGVFLLLLYSTACPLAALEIGPVIRDFLYPNIFEYKEPLIGSSHANKFNFEEAYDDDSKPEFFRFTLHAREYELGKTVRVLFHYKPHRHSRLKTREETVLLDRKRKKLRFEFSHQENKNEGRIDLWSIEVFEGDRILA